MKLQVKDSGAWRNVLVFDAARAAAVEDAAAALLRAAGGSGTAMRISDGDLVKARCEQPACVWTPSSASATPSSKDAAGWKWAPVEPTEAMVHAGEDVPAPRPFGKVYRAMLAAAPVYAAAVPSAEQARARLPHALSVFNEYIPPGGLSSVGHANVGKALLAILSEPMMSAGAAGAHAELSAEQIAAAAAVLGDDGKPVGRNTAIMVADAMGVQSASVRAVCTTPPPGWYCTQERGHDGPCAAHPTAVEHDHSEGGHHD